MTSPLVIAVDCSTTAAKAIVVDARGNARSGSRPGHPESGAPLVRAAGTPTGGGHPGRDRPGARPARPPGRVAAICVTHQRETFVCLDADDRPIRPAILWLDGRAARRGAPLRLRTRRTAVGQARRHHPRPLQAALAARSRTGHSGALSPRRRRPHLPGPRHDGTLVVEHRIGRPAGPAGPATGDYSEELLEMAGLRREQLPDLVPTGTSLGPLRTDRRRAWGLDRERRRGGGHWRRPGRRGRTRRHRSRQRRTCTRAPRW